MTHLAICKDASSIGSAIGMSCTIHICILRDAQSDSIYRIRKENLLERLRISRNSQSSYMHTVVRGGNFHQVIIIALASG